MPAIEPFFTLVGISTNNFSKEESILLNADIFVRVCKELKNLFRKQYQNYFRLMNFNLLLEEAMLDDDFIRVIINDILSTGEYTLAGIACYTNIHEDIILDLASGINKKPLATYLIKTIELHKEVRRELYNAIGKKINSDYLDSNFNASDI